MSDTRAFLLAHAAAYPALTLTDLFKALYQSAFGCEHLVADPSAAEAYIAAEAEGARPCGRKSVEPLDGPYVRVHLDTLKKGLSARTLARLFALSAEHRDGAQAEFEKKLAVLTEMIRQGELPFDADEAERAISAWRAAGFPPCHHSETFRQAYAPAYRLVKAAYAPLLPLLPEIDARLAQGKRTVLAIDGPCGSGKTTLAAVIANEMGVNMRITSGPTIEKPGDLAALLTNLQENDILFVDEIHRMNRAVEEILYPAMEDFAIDIIIGKGPSANSIRLDLPKFTLIGATTRSGQLSAPLRDRFGVILRLELYTPEELRRIVERSAGILGISIEHDGAEEIARRSRGTPRIANRILRRVRDFAQVTSDGVITRQVADEALNRLEIDHLGLDSLDRRMLRSIIEYYSGGPVGVETLAATINEESVTLEDVYEPYLLQCGLMIRTPQGRQATLRTFEHLGIEPAV